MTDNVINVDFNPQEERKLFTAIVQYDMPNSGMITCAAKNLDEARELIQGMSKGVNNLVILDVFETKNAPELAQEFEDQDKEPTTDGTDTVQ